MVREGSRTGLAISKHLVEAIGEHIVAASVWGEGRYFSFTRYTHERQIVNVLVIKDVKRNVD